jgi:hypothetical protein
MNGKIGGAQGLRRGVALGVTAAVAVLATACGGGSSSISGGSSSAGADSADSAAYRQDVAFVQCLRSHGEPTFPDPRPGHLITVEGSGTGGNSGGPLTQAVDACRQLAPRTSTTGGHVTSQELSQALKAVQCLRGHGEPTFPDPQVVNGTLDFSVQPGVIQSAQFQAALNACRSLLPKGFQLP